MTVEKLRKYKEKRDFSETPEPKSNKRIAKGLSFVVQRHDASHLHYDFRIEHDGVLVSWAVPKGPSMDPNDKRLAVHVEDHPLSYGSFEGTIPKGNYGAGTVRIWDSGTYLATGADSKAESEKMITAGLKKGHVAVTLSGKKLKGEFDLIHMQDKNWLLIKKKTRARES